MSYEAWGDNDDDYASVSQLLEDGWRSGEDISNATNDVINERLRQQDSEGWTPEHDDQHTHGEMAAAALCYIGEVCWRRNHPQAALISAPPAEWPWDATWWKPKGDRADLVRAAALIIAEIERLDRAEAEKPTSPAATSHDHAVATEAQEAFAAIMGGDVA
jgi:hypothetical protein